MRTGIRFTYLQNGDPLLSQDWTYQGVNGIDAIIKKIESMTYYVDKLHITDIIDRVQLGLNSEDDIYPLNTGLNGYFWPFNERIDAYKRIFNSNNYKINLILELEFPTNITEENVVKYAQAAIKLMSDNIWITDWQIMTEPESIDEDGNIKCSPELYVRLLQLIHDGIKDLLPMNKLGGPGIFKAITEYVESIDIDEDDNEYHSYGWLAEALGEFYGIDEAYTNIGPLGFLPYIKFFAFQGRQDTAALAYDKFINIMKKVQEGINTHAISNNFVLDIPWISTYQGHAAESKAADYQAWYLQGYYDLREYMNNFALNIVPIKKQLVDEYFDPILQKPEEKNFFGLINWSITSPFKPSYEQFKLVLEKTIEFSKLPPNTLSIKRKKPFEDNDKLDFVMLMDEAETKLLTLVWPKNPRVVNTKVKHVTYDEVSFKADGTRTMYFLNEYEQIESLVLFNPKKYVFDTHDFVIVIENLIDTTEINPGLKEEISKKLRFYKQVAQDYMDVIPSTYNHDIYDTNFYKLLRSVAIETGEAMYYASVLEDNMYLNDVHFDAIYNNFGSFVGIKWESRWSEDEYRNIIKAIFESLLTGATKKSIEKCLQAYTQLDVHVYELVHDYNHYGLAQEDNWDNRFRFTVEIERDIDDPVKIEDLVTDTQRITNIVKPAHTVPIIMVLLVGTENYKEWFEQRHNGTFKDSDIQKEHLIWNNIANRYGWKTQDYNFVFKTSPNKTVIDQFGDKIGTSIQKLNGPFLLGPRYTLYERNYEYICLPYEFEYYNKWLDEINIHIETFYEETFKKPVDDSLICHTDIISEVQYGYGRNFNDKLKTNGGLIYNKQNEIISNENRTVFGTLNMIYKYAVDYWLETDSYEDAYFIFDDKFNPVSDETKEIICQIIHDVYDKPIDEYSILLEWFLHEDYRWRLNYIDDNHLLTNGYCNKLTLHNSWSVQYKLYETTQQYFCLPSCEESYHTNDIKHEPIDYIYIPFIELPYVTPRELHWQYIEDSISEQFKEVKELGNDYICMPFQDINTRLIIKNQYDEYISFKTWGKHNVKCSLTNYARCFGEYLIDQAWMKMYTVNEQGEETIIQQSFMI